MTLANSRAVRSAPSGATPDIDGGTSHPRPPRRVCVIGNSAVAAVHRAYKDGFVTDGFEFSFFARNHPYFDEIAFEGTSISGCNFSSGGNADMLEYDDFVIYGDLISPSDPFKLDRLSSSRHYSLQVLNTVVRNRVVRSKSAWLSQALHEMTGKPVFLLSKNISLPTRIESNPDYELISTAIAAALAPGHYIPHPAALLSAEGRVEFHKNAIGIGGSPHNPVKTPTYDTNHLNAVGGALILGHIVAHLRLV
ncbi:MAG TPA: hypothetical protein VL899_15700 [Alphaproteobacteria bacterium]|jgi:hypothetical protein|nr:hypothetical protein [Alphaproteobacteria bacterium]